MTSLRAKIFIKIMKAMSMKDEGIFDVKKKRENLEKRVSMFKMPRKVKVEHIDVDGIPAEWLYPHNSEKNRVILYLHGGYYTSGSPKTHRSLAARIGKTSNSPVLLIDYRLAPENPFPAALEDSISAYNWITKQKGIKTNKLMIAGDSAGGGLVLATLIKLRDEKNALPAAAICLSPWTDLALTGDSIKTKADEELMLTEIEVRQAAQFYLKEAESKNPLASPLYADLNGLPPLLIQTGTAEILLDDSTRFVDKAKTSGVKVTFDLCPEMFHAFQMFGNLIPESKKALKKIGMFVQEIFSQNS
ncbi:MAG: alpha/beta hydrolase [Candidatus Heimdallarchaeota archaeon]|nr:alpha/beta hydrolase [Candidatus Heimdallarchaeota archaeon]MCK4954089.1 alpha/beta hydrolase [Candidatus Heimdallarchaeota archaeon]